MGIVFPITFEVPAHPEPIGYVNQFAWGLSGLGLGGGAGNKWDVPTDLDGIVAIRVMVPKKGLPGRPTAIFDEALRMLVHVNLWCMRAKNRGILPIGNGRRGSYPSVYEAICYKPKVKGDEELWDSTEALHQRGHGVCEDLACTRVAERWLVEGPACRPFLIPHQEPGRILFHVVIKNPNGSIEDPSGVLGMTPGQTTPRCRIFLTKKNEKCSCDACKEGKACDCGGG